MTITTRRKAILNNAVASTITLLRNLGDCDWTAHYGVKAHEGLYAFKLDICCDIVKCFAYSSNITDEERRFIQAAFERRQTHDTPDDGRLTGHESIMAIINDLEFIPEDSPGVP